MRESLIRFVVVGCAFLALAASPAIGQTAGQPKAAEPPPSLFDDVVDVRVVNIEAVVTDKKGERVKGLGPADFSLMVDGKEVPVQYFTEIQDRQAVAPPAGGEVSGLPSLDPGGAVATSYLVFIDEFFSVPVDRDVVLRSLKAQLFRLGPEDSMAVVAFDGRRVSLLSRWTGSQKALAQALDQAIGRNGQGLQRLAELNSFTTLRQTLMDGTGRQERLSLEELDYASSLAEQLERSVAAAANAMRGAASPPGRKVMLLLTGGWPFSVAQYVVRDRMRQPVNRDLPTGEELYGGLVDTANRLGYTIYPVDVKGIQGSGVSARSNSFPVPEDYIREQEIHTALQHVALETGGRALLDADRAASLERAESDTRSYYWLGFTPEWKGNDQRHDIRLRVLRPGLEVRSRESFLDLSRKAEVGLQVESSMLFGPPPGSPRMMVKLEEPVRRGRSEMELPVTLGIPVAGFTPLQVDGRYVADLVLHVFALDDQGRRSEIPAVPIRVATQEAPSEDRYVPYSTRLLLRRTGQHLVLAVFDPVSGRISTAQIDMAPPGKEEKRGELRLR
ncbi:MAG TPA: VWA domain-containing protein [Thermoanaerobaculia bacterium]|nr:VWA domain-containing protein [Thermoanaerobaculia bacterium]